MLFAVLESSLHALFFSAALLSSMSKEQTVAVCHGYKTTTSKVNLGACVHAHRFRIMMLVPPVESEPAGFSRPLRLPAFRLHHVTSSLRYLAILRWQ